MSAALRLVDPDVLPEKDQETATNASRAVAKLAGRGPMRVDIGEGESRQTFVLPAPAVRLLADLLTHLGAGTPVSIIPDHIELTTQEAADFLNVSRPFVVKLIERGELPHRMVGTHRRATFSDVRAYKEQMKKTQREALDFLIAEAQEMGAY